MTGNLSFQIEHHLFPDLPSNRYAEIATEVRALCAEYGLPYTTAGCPPYCRWCASSPTGAAAQSPLQPTWRSSKAELPDTPTGGPR